jgi:hypothetical protein
MPSRKSKSIKKTISLPRLATPKVPSWLGLPNLENQYLAWRFSNADIGGPYSCTAFDLKEFQLLWDRLREFEIMNVEQWRKQGSYHSPAITNISREAKKRLRELRFDDIDVIHSFHITGLCRLWCMKHQNIMCVLWWDRKHEVYSVGKKHT